MEEDAVQHAVEAQQVLEILVVDVARAEAVGAVPEEGRELLFLEEEELRCWQVCVCGW